MEFTGRLAAFPASNLLQWAAQERVNGSLVVRRSQREKRIGFRAGRIVDCRSNQAQELFGQFLLIHGHLGPEPLSRALSVARARKQPLGETVGELGMLGEDELRETLSRALSELIQDLFLWKQGLFYFVDEPAPQRKIEPEVDSTELLLEGTRWIDELARIREVLVDDGVVVRPGPRLGKSSYSPLERRILEAIGEEASLRDLYPRVGGVHFPFLAACHEPLQKGAIEITRGEDDEPTLSRELDLREVLLSFDTEDVLVGSESAIFPLEAIESLVPVWIQEPAPRDIDALPIPQRAFLEGFDGRNTLRKLLSPAAETRADQIELLLIELKKRNLLLLPTSLDEVSRRVENNTGLRKLVKKLTR